MESDNTASRLMKLKGLYCTSNGHYYYTVSFLPFPSFLFTFLLFFFFFFCFLYLFSGGTNLIRVEKMMMNPIGYHAISGLHFPCHLALQQLFPPVSKKKEQTQEWEMHDTKKRSFRQTQPSL